MHDMKGRELKVGDRVLVPCRIKQITANDGYCNVTLESAVGRRPDGAKETLAINTGVTLRIEYEDYSHPHLLLQTMLLRDILEAYIPK